jgi:hypothetical protein
MKNQQQPGHHQIDISVMMEETVVGLLVFNDVAVLAQEIVRVGEESFRKQVQEDSDREDNPVAFAAEDVLC